MAFLLVITFSIVGCDQADVVSSSEQSELEFGNTKLILGPSLEALMSPNGKIKIEFMESLEDYSGGAQSAESLADRVVKIGLILEAEANMEPRYGAELAMIEINQAGGVLGLPIALIDGIQPTTEAGFPSDTYGPHQQTGQIMGGIMGFPIGLVIKDNQDDPGLSEQMAEELITKDEVIAIIGPSYSRNALSVSPVAQRFGVPLVTTSATNPNVTAPGDFVFMASFADTFQGEVMARFARESLNAETVALLIEAGDPYVEDLAQIFGENFVNLGGRIVAEEFYAGGDTDFKPQLEAIAAEAPDIVFMPGFAPEVPLAVKQARTIPQKGASGIVATFLGGDGWDNPDLITIGGRALDGCYFSTMFSAESPDEAVQNFARAYQSIFGILPDVDAAMGYDALRLVATAIRRAGSLDKEAIREQLAMTSGYSGATYIRSYNENRHPIKSAVIMRMNS